MLTYDRKYYTDVTFTWNNTILPSGPNTSTNNIVSYLSKRDRKIGQSSPTRFQHFLTHGYMPVLPYVREVDRIKSLNLGSVKAVFGDRPFNYDSTADGSTFISVGDLRTLNYANLDYSISTPLSDSVWQVLRAKAIANANSNVRKNAGLFETFSELRKTQRMFLSTASKVARSLRHVRKGRFVAAAAELGIPTPLNVSRRRSASSNWLEYRYGWVPLYSSLLETVKVTYDFYNRKEFIRFAYGVAKTELTWIGSTRFSTCGPDYSLHSVPNLGEYLFSPWSRSVYSGFAWDVSRRYDRALRVNVSYIFKITNPNLTYANDLGIADPVSIAWELLPFSFVADWFFNVGDVLEQIGAFTGKEFLSGSITFTEAADVSIESKDISLTDCSHDDVFLSFTSPASIRRSFVRSERQVLTSQPLFGFHSENGLNGKRIADAVSLIRQLTR